MDDAIRILKRQESKARACAASASEAAPSPCDPSQGAAIPSPLGDIEGRRTLIAEVRETASAATPSPANAEAATLAKPAYPTNARTQMTAAGRRRAA